MPCPGAGSRERWVKRLAPTPDSLVPLDCPDGGDPVLAPNAFLLEVPPQAATDIGRALVALLAASFGATVGSFLNVCIWRMPRKGLRVGKPRRSFCPLCGSLIAWFDNLPVLSWVALRGRCRSCRAPISLRYPVVEVMTAVLFAVVADRFLFEVGGGPWGLAFLLALLSALIVGSLIDMDLRILPDEITVGGMHVLPLAMFLLPELRIGPVGDSIHRLLDLVADGSSGVRGLLPAVVTSTAGACVVLAICGLALCAGGYCVYRSFRRRRLLLVVV